MTIENSSPNNIKVSQTPGLSDSVLSYNSLESLADARRRMGAGGAGYPAIVLEFTPTQWGQPKIDENYPVIIPGIDTEQCEESRHVIGATRCNDCHTVELKVEHCERWECPVCGSRKVRRQAKRIIERMKGFKDAVKTSSNPRHIVISSTRWVGMDLKQISKSVNNLFARYLRELSGVYVIHMFRIRGWDDINAAGGRGHYFSDENIKRRLREFRDEAKKNPDVICPDDFWSMVKQDVLGLGSWREYVYVSPHIHILGWGLLPNSKRFFEETGGSAKGGFIYKTKEREGRSFDFYQAGGSFDFTSNALKTLNYLGGHAAILQLDDKRSANRIFRPFGFCSVYNLKETMDLDYQNDREIKRIHEKIIKDKKCPTCKSLDCSETRIRDIHNYYHAEKFDDDFNPVDQEGDIIKELITPIKKFEWEWYEYHFAGYDVREAALIFARSLPGKGIKKIRDPDYDLDDGMGTIQRKIMSILKEYDRWKENNQDNSLGEKI